MKPWMIQSLLTFDSMDRTLSVTIHWKAVEQYFTVVVVVVGISQSERLWISALNLEEHPLVWLKRPILEEQLLLQY